LAEQKVLNPGHGSSSEHGSPVQTPVIVSKQPPHAF
jgi:hypothetical protein